MQIVAEFVQITVDPFYTFDAYRSSIYRPPPIEAILRLSISTKMVLSLIDCLCRLIPGGPKNQTSFYLR